MLHHFASCIAFETTRTPGDAPCPSPNPEPIDILRYGSLSSTKKLYRAVAQIAKNYFPATASSRFFPAA
jgi:hypothetical protein